jgi:hypothetical protein
MSSFEKSQMKKRRTGRNTTATRKMTKGTKATRSERALAVAKSPLRSFDRRPGGVSAANPRTRRRVRLEGLIG